MHSVIPANMKLFHQFHAHNLPLTTLFQLPILLCLKSQYLISAVIWVMCASLNTWVQGRFEVRALKSVRVSFG